MRIVLADDENLVRASLLSMLEEINLPIQVVGQASDGLELISLVEQLQPDIAFVDIKMPGTTGLDAIRALKKISPDTQCIILTGFKEFDYAYESISLGVFSFLLKPISSKQLEQTLRAAMEQTQSICLTQNKIFENEIISIINGLSYKSNINDDSTLGKYMFQSALVIFDSFLDEKTKAEKQLEFCVAIRSAINENSGSSTRFASFILPTGELAIVGSWFSSKGNEGRDTVRKFFISLQLYLKQYSTANFSISIIKDDDNVNLETLLKKFNQMHNFSSLRVISGHGKILTLEELYYKFKNYSTEQIELCDMLIRLSFSYSEKAYAHFIRTLNDLEIKMPLSDILSDKSVRKSIENFISHSIGYEIPAYTDSRSWIKNLRKYGETLLKKLYNEDNSAQDIMSQVLMYIEQNYSKDFGLAQIAEQFNVTPNYLSALFHKKNGTTFMTYITNFRMLKAKELLSKPNTKVQQVAEFLGYSSSRHFSRVFKEYHGCYPSEYLTGIK